MLDKEIICAIAEIRYNLDEGLARNWPVEDDFYYAVKHLPLEYNEYEYMSFLDDWGTVRTMDKIYFFYHCSVFLAFCH